LTTPHARSVVTNRSSMDSGIFGMAMLVIDDSTLA
jgi:hypothetical protein